MRTLTLILFAAVVSAQDVPEHARKVVDETMLRTVDRTFEFVGGQLLNGDPVKGAPYSAEAVTEMTQTLADGSHIVNRTTSTLYRDSEGRERREESIGKLGPWNAEGAPAKAVFISDPVAKASYSLDANTHTAHRMPISMGGAVGAAKMTVRAFGPGEMAQPVAGDHQVMIYQRTTTVGGNAKNPPKVEQLGTQLIEGVQAEGTRTTVTIPAGAIGNERDINVVSERWYSPELHETVMSKRSDPRTGESVYRLTNINRSEPLHTMFEIPADYTVISPKDLHFEIIKGKDQDQF